MVKEIWVWPEIQPENDEIDQVSLGLLTEARLLAARVGGKVTAVILGDRPGQDTSPLSQYGVSKACFFVNPLLKFFTAEVYATVLLPKIREENPWLFLMGDTPAGSELAARLAGLMGAGLVSTCTRIDLTELDRPRFYRSLYGSQLEQECTFQHTGTMLVTMVPAVLNAVPSAPVATETIIIEPALNDAAGNVRHLEFLPADYRTVDVAEAETIVAAGMGAISDDIFPLVEELAGLLKATIGTTRPVIDRGRISRERMIGQTGKVVCPAVYLALGISGASHHVGGIQESGRIIAVNRDPYAPIFQNTDVGAVADLREVLPLLIRRIKTAREHGEII